MNSLTSKVYSESYETSEILALAKELQPAEILHSIEMTILYKMLQSVEMTIFCKMQQIVFHVIRITMMEKKITFDQSFVCTRSL